MKSVQNIIQDKEELEFFSTVLQERLKRAKKKAVINFLEGNYSEKVRIEKWKEEEVFITNILNKALQNYQNNKNDLQRKNIFRNEIFKEPQITETGNLKEKIDLKEKEE